MQQKKTVKTKERNEKREKRVAFIDIEIEFREKKTL